MARAAVVASVRCARPWRPDAEKLRGRDGGGFAGETPVLRSALLAVRWSARARAIGAEDVSQRWRPARAGVVVMKWAASCFANGWTTKRG